MSHFSSVLRVAEIALDDLSLKLIEERQLVIAQQDELKQYKSASEKNIKTFSKPVPSAIVYESTNGARYMPEDIDNLVIENEDLRNKLENRTVTVRNYRDEYEKNNKILGKCQEDEIEHESIKIKLGECIEKLNDKSYSKALTESIRQDLYNDVYNVVISEMDDKFAKLRVLEGDNKSLKNDLEDLENEAKNDHVVIKRLELIVKDYQTTIKNLMEAFTREHADTGGGDEDDD